MALTDEQADGIGWALTSYAARSSLSDLTRNEVYALTDQYYHGEHRLLFATEKFRNTFGALFTALAENLCAMCVDVMGDRLQIEGFVAVNEADNDRVQEASQEVWRRNRLQQRSRDINKDALKQGDAYVVVWPDPEDGFPVVYPNAPGSIAVEYHREKVGYIVRAAKSWRYGKQIRLNVYYRDRIEKYVTLGETGSLPSDAKSFTAYQDGDEAWPLVNPYDKVPVFHLGNGAGVGQLGRSEIADVIPLQDALNKSLADMLVAMEFEAFAQRWATGIEVEDDADGNPRAPFKQGIDRLWVAGSEMSKFGEFSRADLKNFVEVQNSFRAAISRVSGVPLHYFMLDPGGWPSGVALKTAETRLTAKIRGRQESFGAGWADLMRFCLRIQGQQDVELDTLWADATPQPTEAERWETAPVQLQTGVSQRQVLVERGYTPEQVDEFRKDSFELENGDGYPAGVAGE